MGFIYLINSNMMFTEKVLTALVSEVEVYPKFWLSHVAIAIDDDAVRDL